jgi:hypothetical protein
MREEIVVDIETCAIEDVDQYLDPVEPLMPPDLDAIQPAKNLVDPAKIAADIEKRRKQAVEDYERAVREQERKRAERIDGCGLDPDLCRVAAIGWQFAGEPSPQVRVCRTTSEERDALEYFWRDAMDRTFVTFNGLTFDLPVLMRRSLYLGIGYPLLNLDRYRTPHIDLLRTLTFNYAIDRKYWHGLKFYLARFGYAVDDLHTGADIAGLIKAGDWAAVAAHCEADVKGTHWLAQRIGAMRVPQEATGAF